MRKILLIFCILCMYDLYAQDIHFSQFYRSYLNLNPALTGQFDGDYRINANLRNQWNSISEPYQSFSLAADAKNISRIKGIHAGIAFYNDQAGVGDLNSNQIAASFALTFPLNKDSTLNITTAVQPNYTFKNINFGKFKFDKQFDGTAYNPSLPNGENFDRSSFSYFNLHMGVYFNYKLDRRKIFDFGAGLFNVLTPQQNFFSKTISLDNRFTFHAGSEYILTEDIDILPRILYSTQGKFQEMVIGTNLRYYLNKRHPAQNLYAGLWYRNKDALFLNVGMDYGNLHAGVSYDINISDLEEATNKKGGFEFSLTYIIKQFHAPTGSYRRCPKFL